MCYRDVTHPDPKSTRCVNPLDPVYTVPTKEGPAEEIGPVVGAKPALFGNAPSKNYNDNKLNTSDIHGGQANTKGLGVFANAKRRLE